ncbi:MAG: roadblock/LC7 domain-containing protein [Candidatus Thorarchaeota archaeon]|nr:roadblock/LC7 domain-containing protein [Candidatus Thorarchaeota archaeon]
MSDELTETLQNIKTITGVENVVLIQKDGLPVASAGVWFSKEEVFAVASSTCAIFGVAKLIHGDFKYLLMESETSKVFLASLPNDSDYFLTVTTAPRVNLAALFIEMKDNLSRLSYLLRQHIDGRLPPLRSYSSDETSRVLEGFAVAEGRATTYGTSRSIISLDRSQALSLRALLRQVHDSIPNIGSVFLSLSGGVRVSLEGFTNDRLAAMSFALHDASERVVRTLRNSSLQTVMCETDTTRHFIYSVPNGVFSLWVDKDSQKLGLMRLLLKHYIEEIRRVLSSVSMVKPAVPDDLKELLLAGSSDGGLLMTRRDK